MTSPFGPLASPARCRSKANLWPNPFPGGYTAYSEYEVKFTYGNGVVHHVRTTKADNIYGGVEDPKGQRNGVRFDGQDGWLWVNRGNLKASDPALHHKTSAGQRPTALWQRGSHGQFL